MKRFLIAATLALGLAGIAVAAHAYSCQTTCYGYGNTRTCNTYCW